MCKDGSSVDLLGRASDEEVEMRQNTILVGGYEAQRHASSLRTASKRSAKMVLISSYCPKPSRRPSFDTVTTIWTWEATTKSRHANRKVNHFQNSTLGDRR